MQKQGSKLPEKLVKKIQLKEHRKKWSATHKGLIFGIENEPVAADLYKEYLLSLPDIKEVTVQEIGLIQTKKMMFWQQALTELQQQCMPMVTLNTEMWK